MERRNWTIGICDKCFYREAGVSRTPYYITPDIGREKLSRKGYFSQDTALHAINDLIAKGMLHKSGEGGRSSDIVLPED